MSEGKVVAIHQPNFFPWLGYFNKLARCDRFIVLDNVQFPKTGGCWVNRVKILAREPIWFTVPVVRNYHGTKPIADIEINEATDWREKFLKTLKSQYGRAPFYGTTLAFLEPLIRQKSARLADYNIQAIRSLADHLGLSSSKIVLASTLPSQGEATDLLISLVKAVGGTTYLSGDGAGGYQDQAQYGPAGITLQIQNFQHPRYPQHAAAEFSPGLSIIDCLMNCGTDATAAMVQKA